MPKTPRKPAAALSEVPPLRGNLRKSARALPTRSRRQAPPKKHPPPPSSTAAPPAAPPGPPTTHKRDTLKGRIVRRTLCAKHVADAVGPITRGCELYGLTKGSWSLIDLIEHALAATGPADITLSTWTAAHADIGFALRLLTDGRIRSMRFIVDYSFPSRQPAYCSALREAFGDQTIRVTKNHAKFVLVRNAIWNVVIRTSMNLNENRRLESWELSDDHGLADFLQQVIDQLFAEQSAPDAFGRKPGEHVEAFESEWQDSGDADAAARSTDTKKHFGDGPYDVDLRRAGLTYQ